MPPDKAHDNLNGNLAPRPVHVFGRGRVRSQREFSQPFESRTPVVQLFFGRRRSQPRSLPFDENFGIGTEAQAVWQAVPFIWRYKAPRALPKIAAATIRL